MEKESKLSYDGRNLMTRIPRVIEREAKLKKGNKLIWKANKEKLSIRKKDINISEKEGKEHGKARIRN